MYQEDRQTVDATKRQADSECIKKTERQWMQQEDRQTVNVSRRQTDSGCNKKTGRQ